MLGITYQRPHNPTCKRKMSAGQNENAKPYHHQQKTHTWNVTDCELDFEKSNLS